MKMKKISAFFMLLLSAAFVGCEAEYNAYDNAVFLAEARQSTSSKIVIDDKGGEGTFSARLSKATDNDVNVTFNVDPVVLSTYNKVNGGDYHVLPADYYTLSSTEGVIKAGKIGCEPVAITVKPFDGNIDQNKKYAIPVVLESASGCGILQGVRSLVLLIDQVVVTNGIHIDTNGQVPVWYDASAPLHLPNYTLEWLVNMDYLTRDNVSQWMLKQGGKSGAMKVYTRFGDVTCPQDHLQLKFGATKTQSAAAIAPKKWNHIAVVYDGANIMIYFNGVLDSKTAYGTPGEAVDVDYINFANNIKSQFALHGAACEMRVWSVARSQSEIANNMYTVDPTTEGLEIYWKANEGEGKVLKDYSGHGRDGVMAEEPTWQIGLRFPEGK